VLRHCPLVSPSQSGRVRGITWYNDTVYIIRLNDAWLFHSQTLI